ncbi:hypothetical protein DITRI_Ditri01bG0063300 [Diplodiscus trichospermus]
MGDNFRRKFPFPPGPSPSSDLQACSSELTRTKSGSSGSGVTIESFRDPTANARQGQTMVWTNEKHNSYLDFLEASFVKQLHSSMSLRGHRPQEDMWKPCPTPELPANGHNSSHQISVLQDGCCQKNYTSDDPLLDSTADSCDIMGSPWLHRFTSAGESSLSTFPVPRETVLPNDEIYLREVSDQNFVEEDQREKASCEQGAKHLKMMAMVGASSYSQVMLKFRIVSATSLQNISCFRWLLCFEISLLLSLKLLFRLCHLENYIQ